jgi:hypothetical protein
MAGASTTRSHLWAVWFAVVVVGFLWQFVPRILERMLPRLAG